MSSSFGLFPRPPESNRILYDEENSGQKLATLLWPHLPITSGKPIVFICIGTDRSTGDSLGPLIGTLLDDRQIDPFYIYGTLEDPIHAVNLAEKLELIQALHPNAFIVAIDACLGRLKSVGGIQVLEGPLKPGAGVQKELPPVGDIHITGIVNVSGFMEYMVLQNTRLFLVMEMAKCIADGISKVSSFSKRYESLSKEYFSDEKNA